MSVQDPEFTAKICVFGNVSAPDFPDWVKRHAKKLGLHGVRTVRSGDCLEVSAVGQEDMLNALALACSLGPVSILVERIEYMDSKTA